MQLLDRSTITDYLIHDAAWSGSHGAQADYLGMGLIYYTLVYLLRAPVAVCLGSGGGFVPRLMRQAQRDLGLAATARTILVDGNRPAAGWGAPDWLAPDSFFRTQYPDVELVLDLTLSASQAFFDKQAIMIDYLHIDADHSFEACYQDFQSYRHLLHEGSFVTFHDTNYPGAGVKPVIDYIRGLANCEVIDIPDIGAGTALVRIGSSHEHGPVLSQPRSSPKGSSAIHVTRTSAIMPSEPPPKQWKYLESEAFLTRYVLAASFVRHCPAIVEIGGARTPIDQFLTGEHESVLVVDPLIREDYQPTLFGKPCDVSHVRARFQDVAWDIPSQAKFGLIMLGMDFQGLSTPDWEKLWQLINLAAVTVIEFPPSWTPSCQQFDLVRSNTQTRVTFQAKLDLDGNDFGNLENSWPARVNRALYVLEPR